jgi:hypothetical protein
MKRFLPGWECCRRALNFCVVSDRKPIRSNAFARNHVGQRWQSGYRSGLKPLCKAKIRGTKEPQTGTLIRVRWLMRQLEQAENGLRICGAAARSSEEASVMEVERRGIVCENQYAASLSRKP